MLKKCCFLIFTLVFLIPIISYAGEKLAFELVVRYKTIGIYLKNNTNQEIRFPNNLRGSSIVSLFFSKDGELIPNKSWKLTNTRKTEKVAYSSDHVYFISPGYKDDVALPFLGPATVNLRDGNYYVLSIIRDVPDSKEKIRVSNIVAFHSVKNWIYSPCLVNRSAIPSEVLKKIDETIETIRNEMPIAGD